MAGGIVRVEVLSQTIEKFCNCMFSYTYANAEQKSECVVSAIERVHELRRLYGDHTVRVVDVLYEAQPEEVTDGGPTDEDRPPVSSKKSETIRSLEPESFDSRGLVRAMIQEVRDELVQGLRDFDGLIDKLDERITEANESYNRMYDEYFELIEPDEPEEWQVDGPDHDEIEVAEFRENFDKDGDGDEDDEDHGVFNPKG